MSVEIGRLLPEEGGCRRASVRVATSTLLFLGWVLTQVACGAAGSTKGVEEQAARELSRISAEAQKVSSSAVRERPPDVARLLADGGQFLSVGSLEESIDALSLVIEWGEQGAATPEQVAQAQAWVGEAHFRSGELHAAERWLVRVAESDAPALRPFRGTAIARLVDIAVSSGDEARLSALLELTDQIFTVDRSGPVAYARAKALFALGRYAEAAGQASSVSGDELLGLRAAYVRGTALMKVAQGRGRPLDYSAAIDEFERLATRKTTGNSPAVGEIKVLARMAVARLHYETGRLPDAAKSYIAVDKSSVHYPSALFELGWTYVRMGDYRRAERSLEALAERSPGLIDGAEAALLRADLMLRSGRFRDAEKVYEQTRGIYEPLIRRLETFILTHPEPAAYYDKLVASEIEVGADLPRLIVDWAREIAEEQRSFALVDEVARTRQLLVRAEHTAELSLAALSSGAGIRAFPETKRRLKETVRLQNELARVRQSIAAGMDQVAGGTSSELKVVRAERRQLGKEIADLPVSDVEFTVRDAQARKAWDDALVSLRQAQLAADQTQAFSNGLRRVLVDARLGIWAIDPEHQREYGQRLVETEQELAGFRQQIKALELQIELGRQQVGLGGEQTSKDGDLRERFQQALARELFLSASGQDEKGAARNFAKSVVPLVGEMAAVEKRLATSQRQIATQAGEMSRELAGKIAAEAAALPSYAKEIEEFDQAARVLVGEIARQSFVEVRDRLADVVLRADLGLVQKSWETREEQRRRVRRLQRERAREQRTIEDELAEVLDQSGGAP